MNDQWMETARQNFLHSGYLNRSYQKWLATMATYPELAPAINPCIEKWYYGEDAEQVIQVVIPESHRALLAAEIWGE